jgi:hypothetical protein
LRDEPKPVLEETEYVVAEVDFSELAVPGDVLDDSIQCLVN